MIYRNKHTIEAVQFTGNISDVVALVGKGAKYEHGELQFDPESPIGPWTVTVGDWVTKDHEGFFDVIRDEDFQREFEVAAL